MFGTNSWIIGKIGGIEIRVDPSWSFIAFLIAYSFFVVIDVTFSAIGTASMIALAALMALIFFGSVLLHELAHSWLAVARGVEVESITLFLFGGATKADLETKDPTDELLIASIGPLTSFAIAGFLWLVAVAFGPGTIGGFVAGRLGWINFALAVFNLVPGFPLDGGRVLRSLVWRRTGNIVRATRVAARGGQFVGYGLIGIGVLEIFVLGALVGGLWLIAIGWFLSQAAQASFLQMQVRRILSEVPAARIMSDGLVAIPAHISIEQAVDEFFMGHDFNAFPVNDGDDTVALITMGGVKAVPREDWSTTIVRDVAKPLDEAYTVSPSKTLDEVVGKLMSGDVRRVVVVDDGQVRGIISPRDITRWLERSQDLGLIERAGV
jgi:Zn-dependent protease/CBS domain-containing protein